MNAPGSRKNMVSTPTPPDPVTTANAQSQMNKETAIAQNNLNTVNQVTPQGSVNYTTNGYNSDGTPIRTATQTYSPGEQKVYDLNTQTRQNIGQIGVDQSSRIGSLLGTPVNLSNDATEARLLELGRKRLDPILAQRTAATETDLINRGITPGTEAYDRAMLADTQGKNDAYDQLLLSGHGQSVQEALTQRNQPINEITALMSGSQVSQPNFVSNTPQATVAPTDYSGLVTNNYNQQVGQQNAMIGGIAGLGGAALGGWAKGGFAMPSDRRLKTDIAPVGKLDNGLTVYRYRYNGENTFQIGLMADEVENMRPDAVVELNGFKHVYYAVATL